MRNARLAVLAAVLSALLALFVRDRLAKPRGGDDEVATEFFRRYHAAGIHRDTYWLGVPIQQTPTDMWMVQQILTELRPDVLVETGTLKGGSSLYYASVLQAMGSDAQVVTVDIEAQVDRAAELEVFRERVIPIVGDSVAPETIEKVAAVVRGRPALVLLDSYHGRDHVLEELRLYARFVPVGGYMIVFDTDLNGHPVRPDYGPGPMEAVEAFLSADDRFVADRGREKFMLTMCPKGYLRRVR